MVNEAQFLKNSRRASRERVPERSFCMKGWFVTRSSQRSATRRSRSSGKAVASARDIFVVPPTSMDRSPTAEGKLEETWVAVKEQFFTIIYRQFCHSRHARRAVFWFTLTTEKQSL